MKIAPRWAPLVFGIALAGCPGFGDQTLAELAGTGTGAPPTWENAGKFVIPASCGGCHADPPVAGAPAGFDLNKYDKDDGGDPNVLGAFEVRSRIVARAVTEGSMPPQGTGTLSDGEKATLLEWVNAGAPRGTPETQ